MGEYFLDGGDEWCPEHDHHGCEPYSLSCVLVRTTALAVLVRHREDEVWIPVSQIQKRKGLANVGDEGTLVIPRWLAAKKGLTV